MFKLSQNFRFFIQTLVYSIRVSIVVDPMISLTEGGRIHLNCVAVLLTRLLTVKTWRIY